ncbi:hypothetical protein MtrunA17_Chr3g0124771 [Medicago truncatula]|uniref:Uncharacterized protein n=1 Tax=Medicago truncatula TaxID=3880 RepID=A0A396IXR4_MEDTR|nr:hypothetical protein MtrunA17_Chr3g0124771 [Medicago truncatula]
MWRKTAPTCHNLRLPVFNFRMFSFSVDNTVAWLFLNCTLLVVNTAKHPIIQLRNRNHWINFMFF